MRADAPPAPRYAAVVSDLHLSDFEAEDPARPGWRKFKTRGVAADDRLLHLLPLLLVLRLQAQSTVSALAQLILKTSQNPREISSLARSRRRSRRSLPLTILRLQLAFPRGLTHLLDLLSESLLNKVSLLTLLLAALPKRAQLRC